MQVSGVPRGHHAIRVASGDEVGGRLGVKVKTTTVVVGGKLGAELFADHGP
jgi:hypothetical protein